MSLPQSLKSQILTYIKKPIPQSVNMQIVKRSIPVPFFGDIENAKVATISLNPSNLEFEDEDGNLLRGNEKRFVDRDTLGVADTASLNDDQADKVYNSLINYFHNNPYTGWFDILDGYAEKLFNSSYYKETMVHLDIYPWATQEKWGDLKGKDKTREKNKALQNYNLLKNILLNEDRIFDYVYINGRGVKEQIEKYYGITIKETSVTNTRNKSKRERKMYQYTLSNGTKLIGSSCYIQNPYETTEYLTELHEILAEKL